MLKPSGFLLTSPICILEQSLTLDEENHLSLLPKPFFFFFHILYSYSYKETVSEPWTEYIHYHHDISSCSSSKGRMKALLPMPLFCACLLSFSYKSSYTITPKLQLYCCDETPSPKATWEERTYLAPNSRLLSIIPGMSGQELEGSHHTYS